MASDSEPESSPADEQALKPAKAAVGDRPKKKKPRRPRPPIPRTEEEIDSPTKQTVGMLGILCIMTIIMWAFARGACNYHPPKETRVPRQVTLADLAHDPKNAAVELQQRWLTHDFSGALELVQGSAELQVQQDKAACDAGCLAKRPALEKTVLTSAVMVDVNPLGATARVTSVGLPDGSKSYLMTLVHVEAIWKATDIKVDTGAPYIAPTTLPTTDTAPPKESAAPAPSASAPVLHVAPILHHVAPAPTASH
jgi:hypothetical protein